jgi:TPR repeat protein
MDVRLRLAVLLTTPGIGIHPELAAVTLAGVYVQLGAQHAVPGDWPQAAAYYEMAARLLRTRDVPAFESTVRMALGRALAELGSGTRPGPSSTPPVHGRDHRRDRLRARGMVSHPDAAADLIRQAAACGAA